jgi:hypothetical protein
MTTVSLLAPEVAACIRELQTLDDALAYRLGRLAQPCPPCPPGRHCPDHAGDHGLIADYRRRHGPARVDEVMRTGDGTPPTALALGLTAEARLRELAADGPVLTRADLGSVLFSLEDGLLIEHPLTPATSASPDDEDTEAGPCR